MIIQELNHFLVLTIIAWASLFLVFNSASARVTGTCANCHTMHNSQNGITVASDANETLLVDDCVGCHSAASGSTWKDETTGAPIVYNIVEPSFNDVKGLAGGNFYWVAQGDDTKGHNIFSDNPDEALSGGAPGSYTSGCGTNSCHDNLHWPADKPSGDLEGRYGCQGCHLNVAHHANDGSSGEYKLVTTAAQGWYRFLSGHRGGDGQGVEGGEDPDWQASATSSVHNEYLGKVDSTGSWGFSSGKLGHTTTAFCTGCHGMFHGEQTSGDAWIRHPSDAYLPGDDQYGQYTVYDPIAPVARETLPATPGSTVTADGETDMVMCLSCHRPHGSEYPDLLRWDYDTMITGGGGADGTGCFVCHTNKDGS
jgi:predicted CXXCH cytochrome family protein